MIKAIYTIVYDYAGCLDTELDSVLFWKHDAAVVFAKENLKRDKEQAKGDENEYGLYSIYVNTYLAAEDGSMRTTKTERFTHRDIE